MRARWLKPEFFSDKKIATLGPIAALVYEALWCMADDGGTALCDADAVKAQMFYRWSAVGVPEISEALCALSAAGRIVRYQVGDDTYCTIPTWDEHQKVHKPSNFRHPPMSQGVALPVPEQCGTSESPLPASPPPRHLDSQTPRHPIAPPAATIRRTRSPRPKPATGEAKPDPFPQALCGAAYSRYVDEIGPVDYGRFRKALLPAYRNPTGKHPGQDELFAGIQAFKEARAAAGAQWFNLYTVEKFAQALHEYIRLGSMPIMDEWGEPTERGRAAKVLAA